MTIKSSSKRRLFGTLVVLLMILVVIIVFVSVGLRRVLTDALYARFEKTLAAEVYQLEFQDLKVNPFTGYIIVLNAKVFPRDTARQQYSYINSHFHLTTRKIVFEKVNLVKLMWDNALDLDKIEIVEPDISFIVANNNLVFFPFCADKTDSVGIEKKRALVSFVIKKLDLVDAHFHVINADSTREGDLQGINVSLREITIQRESERDKISYQHFDFSFDTLNATLAKNDLRDFHLHDFKLKVDSLYFEQTPDTVIYHFSDAILSSKSLSIVTSDSIFNIALDSFYLDYSDRSIVLSNVSYKPNISEIALQRKYPYRKEIFNVSADSIHLKGINFDSLMHIHKIQVEEVVADSVFGTIFKDLTKPFPPDHRPKYLAQQFQGYAWPMQIKHVQVTHANLLNTEVKPDGGIGKVNVNRGTLDIHNITNFPSAEGLMIDANAYVENVAHVYLQLNFKYDQPLYTIKGTVRPFEIASLNPFINSYSPIRINKGTLDGMTFSGTVYNRYSSGVMKCLYHDLAFEMEPDEKVNLKTIIKRFVVKTVVNNSNPPSPNLPDRLVKFYVDRDMRTGFILMLVQSVLGGVKETLVMSKDNKQVYRATKDVMKQEEKKNGNRQ